MALSASTRFVLHNLKVWIYSDKATSDRFDENRILSERWYDSFFQLLHTNRPVVGLFVFLLACRSFIAIVLVHVVGNHRICRTFMQILHNHSNCRDWTGTVGRSSGNISAASWSTYDISIQIGTTKLSTAPKVTQACRPPKRDISLMVLSMWLCWIEANFRRSLSEGRMYCLHYG